MATNNKQRQSEIDELSTSLNWYYNQFKDEVEMIKSNYNGFGDMNASIRSIIATGESCFGEPISKFLSRSMQIEAHNIEYINELDSIESKLLDIINKLPDIKNRYNEAESEEENENGGQ